MLKNVKGM